MPCSGWHWVSWEKCCVYQLSQRILLHLVSKRAMNYPLTCIWQYDPLCEYMYKHLRGNHIKQPSRRQGNQYLLKQYRCRKELNAFAQCTRNRWQYALTAFDDRAIPTGGCRPWDDGMPHMRIWPACKMRRTRWFCSSNVSLRMRIEYRVSLRCWSAYSNEEVSREW